MGKKSRQKKEKRSESKVSASEKKVKKNAKTSKKVTKTTKAKKAVKAKKTPKVKLSPEQKAAKSAQINQKIKGGLLILIGSFLLLSAIFLLYDRLFKAKNLANYLPANDTFAVVELNISNSDADDFEKMFAKYPVYNKLSIIAEINTLLNVDYKKEIAPWLGRKIGMALIKNQPSPEEEAKILPLGFIEISNFKQALEFFESHKLENGEDAVQIVDIDGEKIYEYAMSHNIYFSFLDNYMVLSNDKSAIRNIIGEARNPQKRLVETEKYHQIADNLPSNDLAFGYFDLASLTKYILNSPNFIMENGFILTNFEPFLAIFDAEGFSISSEEQGLKIQTYTNFNRELLEGKEFLSFQDKYNASLAEYVNNDAMLIWGGSNLEKQLKRIADILAKGSKASTLIFDGILEAQKDIYVGKEVSLKDDVYPLVKNEFLIAIYEGETPTVQVILELDDLSNDLPKVDKIVDGFVKQNAFFKPEVREVILEDGTVGQEIVGIPEDISKTEMDYNGSKVQAISLGSKEWGIYYTVKDGKLILGSSQEIIENIIDGKAKKLSDSNNFKENIKPILKHADELSYINLKKLLPHIWPTVEEGETSLRQLYLDPFQNVSSGKNYFADGISTIHYIMIN